MGDTPQCPECHGPLTQVGRYWICPDHGQVKPEGPEGPLRIFLSYGHDSNEELVKQIRADLQARGHEVWFDRTEIKSGQDWRRSITEGIVGSQRVLSFLSKYSTRDPGVCLDEIAIAIGVKGGNIQTVLVESEQDVRPPASVSHIQWLDMHDWKQRRDAGGSDWEEWYQEKLSEIVTVVESDESRRFAGEIQTLEHYLEPISSDSRVGQLLKNPLVGRQWLFATLDEWRNRPDSSSRLFWIAGAPGVGKSKFAAHLAHYGRDEVIAVHFCEYDRPEHGDARRIVRTFAFQVATRLPDLRKLLLSLPEIGRLDDKNSSGLFTYLLADPLGHAIDGGRQRYLIVIDALDEAGEGGQNELVELLAGNADRLPKWIGIVVTSRPENDVIGPLQGLSPFVLDTATAANLADLRTYLRDALSPRLQGHPDADGLVEQILAKSEGVFLYVERFCEDLRAGHISLDQPDQFPDGLGGTFHRYFRRLFPDEERFRRDFRPALRAIIAAFEPLPLGVLQGLFGWQDEEVRDFTRELGSLFPVATTDRVEAIRPYHKAIVDWLSDSAKAGEFFISEAEGHRMLAGGGVERFQSSRHLSGYYADYLLAHLCYAEDWEMMDLLLGDDTFLQACSGRIREWLPRILTAWPPDRAVAVVVGVPERYVEVCRAIQAAEYVPDKLIPADALGTIMKRPDGKCRYRDEFIETVETLLTMYSRALDLATALSSDPRYGSAQLRDVMAGSGNFRRMADAVWDRDLEELSGGLANLSNFVKRDWQKGLDILAKDGIALDAGPSG